MTLLQTPDLQTVCGEDPSLICREVLERTDSERWAETADLVFAKPLTILLIVVVAWIASALAGRVIRRFVTGIGSTGQASRRLFGRLRRTSIGEKLPSDVLATAPPDTRATARAETLGEVLHSAAKVIIWTIAGITILGELGVNLGPLIAGAGIAGVALGFGAQTLVRDVVAGFFILVEDQFGVGDVIDAGLLAGTPVVGTVEEVTLRITRIRGADGIVWFVPNGEMLRVGNRNQQWGRAIVDVVVGPTADLDQVQELLKRTAEALRHEAAWSERILEDPEVTGVEAITAEGVQVRVVAQTLPTGRLTVERELRVRLKHALDEAGVPPPLGPAG